jgi:vacuolar-type H+-ATPase subunit E/Vma4
LEDEKNGKIESIQRKCDLEVEKVKGEMERKHRNKIEQIKTEMSDQHDEVQLARTGLHKHQLKLSVN